MTHLKYLFFLIGFHTFSQVERSSELFQIIKEKDSLLFDIGFNTCDIRQFEQLVSEDFEFYHDKGGITHSKQDFIASIKDGLCLSPYKSRRELIDSSLNVFPMERNGVLYGAVETGIHQFYEKNDNTVEHLSGIAQFSHLWLLENGEWMLSRCLSYDHKDMEKSDDETLLFIDANETNRWLKQQHILALGIGYIEHGELKQLSVFGELEAGKPAPQHTIWNVASLTKPVTALVALKLINKGKWNLDEPLSNYYTDPDIAENPFSKKLTTRMVLSHQTGFPNWRADTLSFNFEPGTSYHYSGEGYEYLRKALESKFGKSFDQLATRLIFKPLKMKHTCFFWNSKVDETAFAKWHTKTGERYPTYKNKKPNAADDLLTTVEDYLKFMLHILNGAGLSDQLQREMVAEQVRVNPYKHFGLGWCIDENINSQNDFALVHGGNDIGVHTIVFLIPHTKNGLLIFTNSDNGTAAFEPVLKKFLGVDGQGIFEVEMK